MKALVGNEGAIHEGHRERMREKFIRHGDRIFASYELLEMLLYYALPQGDTNPIAKCLIQKFGSLDAVFRASREQLMELSGVGERVADFILSVASVTDISRTTSEPEALVFDDCDALGEYFVNYLEENQDTSSAIMLLDNSMRMLGVENIEGKNFASGAIRPGPFISAAMSHGATIVAVGYTRRNGLPFPYSGDYETAKLIRDELRKTGVIMLELYIVGGGKCTAVHMQPSFYTSPSPALGRFVATRRGGNTI